MADKLFWIKFFPSDWLGDAQLARCSAQARGVWMDVLCLMAMQVEEYGVLITNGKPWTIKEIAHAVRGDVRDNLVTLYELERKDVMLKRPDGAYFSRRMVRDAARRLSATARQQRHRAAIVSGKGGSVASNVTGAVTRPSRPMSRGEARGYMPERSLNFNSRQDAVKEARNGPAKKGWIDPDEERKRKNREALDSALPAAVDRTSRGDVPKKGTKP